MNKRDFLLAGSGALVSAPGWATALAATAAAPSTGDLQAWQQRLGETFVQTGAAPLRLQRVDAYAGNGRSEQFTLVFAADTPAPASRAGTRLLHGADGRPFALYLDDAGAAADGQALWRADINHLA